MNAFETQNNLKLTIPGSTHVHHGSPDSCARRQDLGREVWSHKTPQAYQGMFLQDSLHGTGEYRWTSGRHKYCYEGKFYCNNKDGYGALSYPDGKVFEGLYKDNYRYGPGVCTYPDGAQDVGLWLGANMARLSCAVRETSIESLAKSSSAKAYLIRFKKIVPINIETSNAAEDILMGLGADENVLEQQNELCYEYVRNPNSNFFDTELYNDKYFGTQTDLTIEIIENININKSIRFTIIATDLLAWNNDDLLISMMNHVFLNRNHESLLSYSVAKILASRNDSRESGPCEMINRALLEACDDGDGYNLISIICDNDLYLNICDSSGNFGLMYAANKDHIECIKMLTQFGCNLNQMNDECLNALSLCILRYLAVQNDVMDWEISFLPPLSQKYVTSTSRVWQPHLERELSSASVYNTANYPYVYIFDLSPIKASRNKKAKPSIDTSMILLKEDIDRKLNVILKTIKVLLELKADPNISEVPLPLLLMSLFTKNSNVLSELLEHGADITIKTRCSTGSLTCLHVLASLPPFVEMSVMAISLFEHGADLSLTANQYHWVGEKQFILAGTEWEDDGKTPFHLLCMRWDFADDSNDYLGDLLKVFMEQGADMDKKYLGHTPLSLAIIRGNTKLMELILQTVDPQQQLDNGMGVPLTVLLLQRYKHILPLPVGKEVINMLLQYGANPFKPVGEGNAIDFCFEENGTFTGSQKKINHALLVDYFMTMAKDILQRYIQGKALKRYLNIEAVGVTLEVLKEFVNRPDALKALPILLEAHQIAADALQLFDLLNVLPDGLPPKEKKGKPKGPEVVEIPINLEEVVISMIANIPEETTYRFTPPETDLEEDKYKVCFECLQSKDKVLALCPRCKLVYFCSEACNLANIKNKYTKHPCKENFYAAQIQLEKDRLRGAYDSEFDLKYGKREPGSMASKASKKSKGGKKGKKSKKGKGKKKKRGKGKRRRRGKGKKGKRKKKKGAKGAKKKTGLDVKEGYISNEYYDEMVDILGDIDPALFNEMFMCCCIFKDKQLYYQFGGKFCRLTYSDV